MQVPPVLRHRVDQECCGSAKFTTEMTPNCHESERRKLGAHVGWLFGDRASPAELVTLTGREAISNCDSNPTGRIG